MPEMRYGRWAVHLPGPRPRRRVLARDPPLAEPPIPVLDGGIVVQNQRRFSIRIGVCHLVEILRASTPALNKGDKCATSRNLIPNLSLPAPDPQSPFLMEGSLCRASAGSRRESAFVVRWGYVGQLCQPNKCDKCATSRNPSRPAIRPQSHVPQSAKKRRRCGCPGRARIWPPWPARSAPGKASRSGGCGPGAGGPASYEPGGCSVMGVKGMGYFLRTGDSDPADLENGSQENGNA